MWGAVGTQMPSKGKTESSASGVRLVSVQSRQGGFWRPDISDLGFEGLEGLNGGAGGLRGLQADGMGQVTVDFRAWADVRSRGIAELLAVARLSRASKDRMRSMAFSLHIRRALSGTEQRSHTITFFWTSNVPARSR